MLDDQPENIWQNKEKGLSKSDKPFYIKFLQTS